MENSKSGSMKVVMIVIIIALLITGFIYCNRKRKAASTSGNTVDTTQSKKTNTSGSSISTNTSQAGWKTYSNTKYGFSFLYPATWNLSEDTAGKQVTITSQALSDQDSIPLEEITFTVTDKHFFNPHIGTKLGEIAYDEKRMTLVDIGPPIQCLSASPLLEDSLAIKSIEYGESTMSDPAHSESAILTKNSRIIIVSESWETGPDDAQNTLAKDQVAKIAGSFTLLNGNTVSIAACAVQN